MQTDKRRSEFLITMVVVEQLMKEIALWMKLALTT